MSLLAFVLTNKNILPDIRIIHDFWWGGCERLEAKPELGIVIPQDVC